MSVEATSFIEQVAIKLTKALEEENPVELPTEPHVRIVLCGKTNKYHPMQAAKPSKHQWNSTIFSM